jgi:hypothetical protein
MAGALGFMPDVIGDRREQGKSLLGCDATAEMLPDGLRTGGCVPPAIG